MGLLGSTSGDDDDDHVETLVENARGDSVTETKLTRVGSKILGTGTFEDRPLVEYLRDDEQPHYALFNTVDEFEFDGEDLEANPEYWQLLVATDQRLLVLVGDETGDAGEVIPYGVVDPETVVGEKDGFAERELRFVAGGVECEFEIGGETAVSEVRAAADYVRDRAETDDVSEAERHRGPVYDVPNLDVAATVWRPDEDRTGSDDGLDLPKNAVAGARGDGVEVVLFDRRLRFERDGRTAGIPLAYVLDVEVTDDEVEFEFGFAGEDGATFEAEHAELELTVEDPDPFERVADELDARRADAGPDDADGPPVVPGGPDAVTDDDVTARGIPEELQDRFDALAALSEDA